MAKAASEADDQSEKRLSSSLRKGPWSVEEDRKLIAYISRYGIWNWSKMAKPAGLQRSGKSCRLRWVNYLKPGIKRGNFTREEDETIIQLHQRLGNRWSVIASSLPGRTDNEIKNYWHAHLSKRFKYINNIQTERKSSPQLLLDLPPCNAPELCGAGAGAGAGAAPIQLSPPQCSADDTLPFSSSNQQPPATQVFQQINQSIIINSSPTFGEQPFPVENYGSIYAEPWCNILLQPSMMSGSTS